MTRPFRVRVLMKSGAEPRVRTFASEEAARWHALESVKVGLSDPNGAYEALVIRPVLRVLARFYVHNGFIREVSNGKDVIVT